LEAWKKSGKTLAIFSSGSVQAQLQFFSYVRDGESTRDIKPLFSAHYDTVNAGPKLEKTSYEKICSELGKDVTKVTFLTDNVKGMFPLLSATLYVKQHTISPPSLPHHTYQYSRALHQTLTLSIL
jgi:enolase-phosphatase E1